MHGLWRRQVLKRLVLRSPGAEGAGRQALPLASPDLLQVPEAPR